MSVSMKKYINKQKYMECQLVTILNAAIYLDDMYIDPTSDEYERLVDFVGARHGSAIQINKAVEYLGLDYDFIPKHFNSVKKSLKNKQPVEIGIWCLGYGYHSCLIVDRKGYKVKVVNFKREETNRGWIDWKELKPYIDRGTLPNVDPCKGRFRSFNMKHGLIGT